MTVETPGPEIMDKNGRLPREPLTTDYLVVGTGATAMAFVDTLLTETDADVVMVDRHDHPGGHWNEAYPFVRLHQPAAYYGVASRELGRGRKMADGLNAGYHELSSKSEILDYYDQVMRQRFLPSRRVRWLPSAEYVGEHGGRHRVKSLLTGAEVELTARRKRVDATHARTQVPSTHAPDYRIAAGVEHIPINLLPQVRRTPPSYTVIGGGKTGMDACLWLLGNGVDPDLISWVMPRDGWMVDRELYQPFAENFERTMGGVLANLQAIVDADSVPHLFELLEERGVLTRLAVDVEPHMYHCAVVSPGELRRIRNVIRSGHVRAIEPDQIVLERVTVEVRPGTLHIDCSARGLQSAPDIPVFDGSTINLLILKWCQPLFSAALIAFIEGRFTDDEVKNGLCKPMNTPLVPVDWLTMWQATLANLAEWKKHPDIMDWIAHCRLDSTAAAQRGMEPDDPRRQPMMDMIAVKATGAAAKLKFLLAQAMPGEENAPPLREGQPSPGRASSPHDSSRR